MMGSPRSPSRFTATPNDIATAQARQLGQHMELGCRLAFAWVAGESFEATLARAGGQTLAWRSSLWGVRDAAQATRLMALGPAIAGRVMKATAKLGGAGKESGLSRTSPVFTNIGVLDESRLRFGTLTPTLAPEHVSITPEAITTSAAAVSPSTIRLLDMRHLP